MRDLVPNGWLGVAAEPILVALIVLAGALFAGTLAFSAYAVVLRLMNERRAARRAALAERWQGALLDVLADPARVPSLQDLVEPNRRLHFIGFVLEFARRVRGEETAVLRAVVQPYLHLVAERAGSSRVEVRARAMQTLGTLGLPEYEDVVLAALDDASPLVAMVAARALARTEDPRYSSAVLERVPRFGDWNRSYLASMLAAMGPEASPGLRSRLADGRTDPWTRSVIAEALYLQGDFEAGDVAAEVVAKTEDVDLLVAALRLLAEVGRPAHLREVRARVLSRHEPIRAQALRALGRLGSADDLPTLLEALDDHDAWAALYAARGVRELGGSSLLLEAAERADRKGRLAAQVLAEGEAV